VGKRPYLITSLNEMPGKDRWIATARQWMMESAQPVIIMWEPACEVPIGFGVHYRRRPYPGHLSKLLPLLEMDLDRDRWFVFTDGADVAFQGPLPDLAGSGYRILLAGEQERHAQRDFWRPHLAHPLYAELADAPIYNVGTWAAVGHDCIEFVRYLAAMQQLYRERGWPLIQVHEQLIFNRWVQANRTRCGELAGLFCTLSAQYTGSQCTGRGEARLVDGRFVGGDGRPYAIVHANGSTKEILDRVSPPSGMELVGAGGLRTGE
jgi:hypothetical protein